MPVHPSDQELLDWLSNSLPPFSRRAIAAHLKRCDDCAQLLDQIADQASYSFLGRLNDPLPGVPERASPNGPDLPTIPGFLIHRPLGRGGTGAVYHAWDEKLGRDVAIKVIHPEKLSPDCLERFKVEARTLAKLRDERIIQIFDFVETAPQPFLVMEFAAAGSLKEMLAGNNLATGDAARLAEAVARGVAVAHAAGVIHRDLKPSNVLLTKSGSIKIGDFGLAKWVQENSRDKTQSGQLSGTVPYMAPEQAVGKGKLTPATDVHALGCMLYEMLTGRVPFRGENDLATLEQIRTADPIAPSRLQPGLPRDLEAICLKCLEKEPARRYATAEKLADDLQRFLNQEPIQARPLGRTARAWRWCRRKPVLAGLLLGLSLALGGLLYAGWEAVERGRRAEKEHEKSEARRAMLQQFVAEFVQIVYTSTLQTPGSQRDHREKQLALAGQHLEQLLQQQPSAPALRQSLAEVYLNLARQHLEVWRTETAEAAAQKAAYLADQLEQENPGNTHYRMLVAQTQQLRGHLFQEQERWADALVSYRKAHARLTELAHHEPTLPANINAAVTRQQVMHLLLLNKKREELCRLAQEQYALLEPLTAAPGLTSSDRHHLVVMYISLANLPGPCLNPEEVLRCRQQAYEQARALNQEPTTDPLAQYRLALAAFHRVEQQATPDDYTEVSQLCERAAESLVRHIKEDPANATLGGTLFTCNHWLGECWKRLGQPERAVQVHWEEVRLWEAQLQRVQGENRSHKEVLQTWHQLFRCSLRLANTQCGAQEPARALATVRRIVAVLERAADGHREDREYRYQIATLLHTFANPARRAALAVAPYCAEALAESLRLAERSRDHFTQLHQEQPTEARALIGLSHAWTQIAKTRMRVGPPMDVEQALRQAIVVQRRLVEQVSTVPEHRLLLAERQRRLGRFLQEQGRLADARSCFHEAEILCTGGAPN